MDEFEIILKSRNWKTIWKLGFEGLFKKKPKVKPSQRDMWLKSGHAPCKVELATFMAVSGRYATAS